MCINIYCRSEWGNSSILNPLLNKIGNICQNLADSDTSFNINTNVKSESSRELQRYKSQLQRLYNVRSLCLQISDSFVVTSQFLSHLTVFNHIEELTIVASSQVIHVIIEHCGTNVKDASIFLKMDGSALNYKYRL